VADLISVAEAAKRLDVVPQRVRAMIADGRLPAHRVGHQYVLDAAAVDRFSREQRMRSRPLNSANAWALLAVLAGLPEERALSDRPMRSRKRVRSLLNEGAEAVVTALLRSQPRAALHPWRVLPSDADGLLEEPRLIKTGLSANAKGIDVRYQPRRDGVDAYVSRSDLRSLERQLRPIENSADTNLLLRVPEGADWILGEPIAPLSVIGADLLAHGDARVARAGRHAVERLVR